MMRLPAILSALALALLPQVALAAFPTGFQIYCGNLPGCGPGQEFFTTALAIGLVRITAYIQILGILMIMVGGAYILLSSGESGMIEKGKNTITWAIIGIFLAQWPGLIINTIVAVEATEVSSASNGINLVEVIVALLTTDILILLNISLLGVALYCGARMVLSFGKEEQYNKAREGLFYAALGAVIINFAVSIYSAFATL